MRLFLFEVGVCLDSGYRRARSYPFHNAYPLDPQLCATISYITTKLNLYRILLWDMVEKRLSEKSEDEYHLWFWVSALKAEPKPDVILTKFGFHTCARFGWLWEMSVFRMYQIPDYVCRGQHITAQEDLGYSLYRNKKERLWFSKPQAKPWHLSGGSL